MLLPLYKGLENFFGSYVNLSDAPLRAYPNNPEAWLPEAFPEGYSDRLLVHELGFRHGTEPWDVSVTLRTSALHERTRHEPPAGSPCPCAPPAAATPAGGETQGCAMPRADPGQGPGTWESLLAFQATQGQTSATFEQGELPQRQAHLSHPQFGGGSS